MNKPLITVIIPIYKVEDLLNRCIDSVLNQTYKNLEIILVDDGSPDKCGEIIDEYAKHDSRIKIIHKENGGLSDARNVAIDVMKGDYVCFIDSDDYVSPNYILNLYNALKETNADISTSWFTSVYEGTPFKHEDSGNILKNLKVEDQKSALEKLLYQDYIETSAWGKLYKASLFENIRYPKGKLYEDIPVTYGILKKCNKVAIIENVDYFYWQRKSSIQNMSFRSAKMDGVKHMKDVYEDIQENYPELKKAAANRYFHTLCNIGLQINDKNEFQNEYKYIWSEIKNVRKLVLSNKKTSKKTKIAAILSYFGFNMMKFVYNIAIKK